MQAQVIGIYSDGTQKFLTDDYEFSGETDDASLIAVTADGLVTGKAAGSADVSAREIDGSNTINRAISVYTVTGLTVEPTSLAVAVGIRADLTVTAAVTSTVVSTRNIYSKAVFVSADPSIAEVNQVGQVLGTGVGSTTVTVTYMDGTAVEVPVTVGGTNYLSTTSASYNKLAGKDVSVTVTNADMLASITNGGYTLVLGKDYTVSDRVVTINTSYLDTLAAGTQSLTFAFSAGSTATLTVTVTAAPTVSTDIAVFDLNPAGGDHTDLVFTMNSYGNNTLTSVKNVANGQALTVGTNYDVSGSTVTIKTAYLATLSTGRKSLTFTFSDGSSCSFIIGVANTSGYSLNATAKDSAGNLYFAYYAQGVVGEIPAQNGDQRGRYMEAGKRYVITGLGDDIDDRNNARGSNLV